MWQLSKVCHTNVKVLIGNCEAWLIFINNIEYRTKWINQMYFYQCIKIVKRREKENEWNSAIFHSRQTTICFLRTFQHRNALIQYLQCAAICKMHFWHDWNFHFIENGTIGKGILNFIDWLSIRHSIYKIVCANSDCKWIVFWVRKRLMSDWINGQLLIFWNFC